MLICAISSRKKGRQPVEKPVECVNNFHVLTEIMVLCQRYSWVLCTTLGTFWRKTVEEKDFTADSLRCKIEAPVNKGAYHAVHCKKLKGTGFRPAHGGL